MKNIRIVAASFVMLLGLMFHSGAGMAEEGKPDTPRLMNINTADAQSISKVLSGVGLKKAQAIVAYREQYGEFKTLNELTDVKGIGAGTVAKNEHVIVFE